MMSLLLFAATTLTSILPTANTYSDNFYTAAVFEYAVVFNYSVEESRRRNLVKFEIAAKVAKLKGADIIIYPEYGVLAAIRDRKEQKKFAEFIPDPKHVVTNPCIEPERYSELSVLRALSCIARDNSLVLVANTAHVEPCLDDTGCRDDGDLHHNTNVAFDSDGTLIGRYHKERLFFEPPMDLPKEQQNPIFTTAFGKFGMFISFDIIFKRITEIAKEGVDAILLPAVWIDTPPFMTSVQMWQWWAIGNNVTFMAANVHHPGYTVVGSGIFTPQGVPLGYTHNPDGKSKLIIAKVPRSMYRTPKLRPELTTEIINIFNLDNHVEDGTEVPKTCSLKLLGESKDFYSDFRCFEENMSNYTLVKLNKTEGHAQACNNGVCCSVRYVAGDFLEGYYLAVHDGTFNMHDGFFWCQQNCLLVRCDPLGNVSCATFPMRTKTRFYRLFLTSNMAAEYIYPSVLASGSRLVPFSDWQHGVQPNKAYINFENVKGRPLLMAGLHGRCYDNDPPYIR